MSSGRPAGLRGMTITQTLQIAGPVLLPGDPGYDDHRKPLNPALDPYPAETRRDVFAGTAKRVYGIRS